MVEKEDRDDESHDLWLGTRLGKHGSWILLYAEMDLVINFESFFFDACSG